MTALENVFLSIKRLPRHYIVTGSAWGSRILIASLQLVSIRILLEGLGAERYAVFLLMNALMNWYLLADMGVGTSLQNYLSESRGDQEASFNYQTMSSILCAGFFLIFLLILYLWSPWLSQTFLKKFDFISEHEKYKIFFVSGIIFLISGVGAIAYKSWYAQYKGYLSNVIPAVAAVIAFLLILFVMRQNISENDKLFYCMLAFISPSALFSFLSLFWQVKNIPLQYWKIKKSVFILLMNRAAKFWIFYILAAGVLNVDFLILSQYLSPEDIAVYGIGTKIFGFAAFFYVSLYAALWPHFTEDISKNNWNSVRMHIRKSFIFSASFIVLFSAILLIFMPFVSGILSPKDKIEIPVNFILLLGIYHIILVWVHGYAIVLQSMSDMKVLLVWSVIQTILSIIFQIFLVKKFGLYGSTLGLILSFLLTAAWIVPKRVFFHISMAKNK